MPLPKADAERIQAAIDQVKADLGDLERYVPVWDHTSTMGGKIYRPIVRRVIASAQRLKELVQEYTVS